MGKLTNLNPPAPIADADLPPSIARDSEISAAINAHLEATDPHSGYALKSSFYSYGDIPSATPATAAINFMAGGVTAAQRSQNGAFIAFHRPGIAANYFGLSTFNDLRFGGWSNSGSSWRVWHEAYGVPVWQAPSDKKLKKSIRPLPSGLEFILGCQPVSFQYNNLVSKEYFGDKFQREKIHYGFLADEFPLQDLVAEKPNGYLGLDLLEIIPFLCRAIQEQQAQINDLKNKI